MRSLLSRPKAAAVPAETHPAAASGRWFLAFLACVLLLSCMAGYQLSQLLWRMNEVTLQRADRLLELEESLDDAEIGLGRQIQEWKDMLLRINSDEHYRAHRQGFIDASVSVQQALLRAKGAMQSLSMDTGEIEQLTAEHKALLSKYITAHGKLNPRRRESSRMADQQVVGIDRELQRHLAAVKAAVELSAKQHLNGTAPQAQTEHRLVGALGAAALTFMALLGFAVATRLLGWETGGGLHTGSPSQQQPSP